MTSNMRLMRRPIDGSAKAGGIANKMADPMSRPVLEIDHPYSDPRWGDGDRDPYRLPSKKTGKRKK
jgi:hypothetical protein